MNEQILKAILSALVALPGLIAQAIAPIFRKPQLFTSSSGNQPEKQRWVKKLPGKLFDAWMSNVSATDLYLGVVDKNSPAANGDHLLSPVLVPAGTAGYLSYAAEGRPFVHGIVVVALHHARHCHLAHRPAVLLRRRSGMILCEPFSHSSLLSPL